MFLGILCGLVVAVGTQHEVDPRRRFTPGFRRDGDGDDPLVDAPADPLRGHRPEAARSIARRFGRPGDHPDRRGDVDQGAPPRRSRRDLVDRPARRRVGDGRAESRRDGPLADRLHRPGHGGRRLGGRRRDRGRTERFAGNRQSAHARADGLRPRRRPSLLADRRAADRGRGLGRQGLVPVRVHLGDPQARLLRPGVRRSRRAPRCPGLPDPGWEARRIHEGHRPAEPATRTPSPTGSEQVHHPRPVEGDVLRPGRRLPSRLSAPDPAL